MIIVQELMYDPVTAGDGYTYERCALSQHALLLTPLLKRWKCHAQLSSGSACYFWHGIASFPCQDCSPCAHHVAREEAYAGQKGALSVGELAPACRKAIAQWINSGHNTSPMTGGHLPKQELTPNYSLRSAIKSWQAGKGK